MDVSGVSSYSLLLALPSTGGRGLRLNGKFGRVCTLWAVISKWKSIKRERPQWIAKHRRLGSNDLGIA